MRRAVSSGFSLIFICEIILGTGVKEIKTDFTFDSFPIAFMILGAHDLVRPSEGRVKNPISLEFALPLPLAVSVMLDKGLALSGYKVSEVEAESIGLDPRTFI